MLLLVSCSAPQVPINAHVSNLSNNIYLEGTKVTFQCDSGPQALLTTTCYADGTWNPPLTGLDCNHSGSHHVSAACTIIVQLLVMHACTIKYYAAEVDTRSNSSVDINVIIGSSLSILFLLFFLLITVLVIALKFIKQGKIIMPYNNISIAYHQNPTT